MGGGRANKYTINIKKVIQLYPIMIIQAIKFIGDTS